MFKIYMKNGATVTVKADKIEINSVHSMLTLKSGENIVAQFYWSNEMAWVRVEAAAHGAQ